MTSLQLQRVHIGKLEMDWSNHLQHFSSSRAQIGFVDWLQNLTALKSVGMSHCRLESLSLDLFRHAPNLWAVELLHAQIDQLHFPEERHQCCGNLTDLNLSYNNLPSINLTQFSELSSLKWLSIAFNRINQMLGALTTDSLVFLDLSGNQLTTIELCQWNATSLTKLHLSQNRLSHMFRCVNRLEALLYLDLEGNSIAKVDFAVFAKNSLIRLNLAFNNISEVLNRQSIARDTLVIMDHHPK
ncbi:AGAP008173-PA-like protein [Anopheles sinensis]|uniref:AGAP008173-PA-like protein n=1 Tax=Anopheles sinensis TaxID=74873 RepID=A0A084W3C0_ANOSI|nr:AGAP008173-PA-like protein [Anopheles sinensis]